MPRKKPYCPRYVKHKPTGALFFVYADVNSWRYLASLLDEINEQWSPVFSLLVADCEDVTSEIETSQRCVPIEDQEHTHN